MIKSQDKKVNKLPEAAGVYLFKQNKTILYIGKATSLRDRVRSYFASDLIATRGPLIVEMVFRADRVDFIKTDSVLEALILEANLIKKHQPKYNTKEKDNKSFNYVVITKEDFPRVLIVRGRNLLQEHSNFFRFTLPQGRGGSYAIKNLNIPYTSSFGPYTDGNSLKKALKIIRKIFPFRDKCAPLGGKPCFNRQLGLCPGVCDGSISQNEYKKIIRKITLLFSGQIRGLKTGLKKKMSVLSQAQKFEQAGEIKKQIFALEYIQDVSLLGEEYNLPLAPSLSGGENGAEGPLTRGLGVFRIEAYDVAHLSGTNNVGVMVVREDGELKKSDYRKFKIRESQGNDIGALKEILERRLKHTEWPMPDLIVVDGGLAQLNTAKSVFLQGETLKSVVAVTKDGHHKAKAIIGDEKMVRKYKKEILLANNEAHRFAVAFHRQRRGKMVA